jgi:hypothetical protein
MRAEPMHARPFLCGLAGLLLAACAATANPDRSSLTTSASLPPSAPPDPAPSAAANPAPSSAAKPAPAPTHEVAPTAAAPSAPVVSAANPASPPAAPQVPDPKPAPAKPDAATPAQTPNAAPSGSLSVGQIGGRPIDVREFLTRLWTRDSRLAKEVLEQITFARLAIYEADRFGISVMPERVDEVVARTWAALTKKLADSGSKLSVEEHIRKNLDVDPTVYRQQLRTDAVVQLLAERCVRAWVLENERVVVRLTEAKDEATASKIRAALDGGRPFADVALEFGAGDDDLSKTTPMVIVRAESQDLARLAFATPIGSVGGPLVQGNRYLFLSAEQRLQPETGPWSTLGPKIEADLAAHRVGDLEYVQWRAAMMRRYQVGFDEFLTIVGEKP